MGRLFEMHPSLVEAGRAAVLDIDLKVLQRLCATQEKRYTPIRRFPSSGFDLSVIVSERELVGNIERHLREFAGDNLTGIEFLRQYTGSPLPEGKKSVSFRLTVAAACRTLFSEDVALIRGRIIDAMRAIGYDLRI